ncbi:hypothetical protein AJ80_01953 [Polytolypa hystricis UAMH7299]|uniref:Sulfhydryl oxidase n=1 Tax=Polytolypa hystricis (strain UAMH7299) TaxID=1447883 RepID=A0A2B7YR14_POLH7|nr:hypothetical protein AJ80_01953 [Polytolypa hystricis UAMH7299]
MAHRPNSRLVITTGLVVFFILTLAFFRHQSPASPATRAPGHVDKSFPNVDISESMLHGEVVMPKLGNETAKAELGRATWKLLHTMMGRYPDKPSEEEKETLKAFIYLFSRLYPCGECASHFREHLKKYPPQVSSRFAAAGWACHVHNEVNEMLHKDIFDCTKIGDFYDCGCAGDDDDGDGSEKKDQPKDLEGIPFDNPEMSEEAKKKLSQDGRQFNSDVFTPVKISAEP